MINVEQVKRDVVNYGALKVYTTFLTISEDEVDPELFNASQLKEIFNSRFDTVKINIDFVEMQEGKWVSVAKELLVFKLSKCSDNEISYMSNVDDEGKLSSLVLTKSGDEVSLEVVEYSIGGESPSGGTKLYKHRLSNGTNHLEVISLYGLPFNDANIDYKLNILSCNILYYDGVFYTVISVKELRLTSTKLLLLNHSDNSFYEFNFNNLSDTVTEL